MVARAGHDGRFGADLHQPFGAALHMVALERIEHSGHVGRAGVEPQTRPPLFKSSLSRGSSRTEQTNHSAGAKKPGRQSVSPRRIVRW